MVLSARIQDKLTVHAWNASRTQLAVCPNNTTVIIFQKPQTADGPWEVVATLAEHDALVTDIAWAPNTNRILTTSQDRNAYVWTHESGEWKPMLVILRITAAATSVQWSMDEQKFAVGSGARVVPICYFEAENNFWVSKMLKGHMSTIQAVAVRPTPSAAAAPPRQPPRSFFSRVAAACPLPPSDSSLARRAQWHPNTPVVATACTDYKCRIFSAYLKNVDGKAVSTPWGDNPKFGTLFYEVESSG